jgi:hypothetical protein
VRSIDAAGNLVDSNLVWWWELPDGAPEAEVRMTCARNALSEIASASKAGAVRLAVVDLVATYALAVDEEQWLPCQRGQIRMQTLLDWALPYPDRGVQDAADELWREVLTQHRAEWMAETQRLVARWNGLARRRMAEAGDDSEATWKT